MDSNFLNRILVGLVLLITTITSYFFNLELFLIIILIILITYDFYNLKIYNPYYLIFLALLPFITIIFFSTKIIYFISIILCLISFLVLYNKRFKKELFLLSVYLFCILLLNFATTDRNIFYIIIFISFFNDTVAYIAGKFIGGPLIIPKISPKKTWSGTSISILLSAYVLTLLNFNILFSFLVSIFMFFGDIFFSYFKRYLNLNDFSLLLKSHGGILDRLDSMFFITIIFQIHLIF
mgnify:CR=1 FL=1